MRTGLTLAGVIAFRMLGLFMILPVFMLLAADMPGFSPAKAGLAVGIYGLTQALLQQPFGKLSDRFGRRPVMLVGLALTLQGAAIAEEYLLLMPSGTPLGTKMVVTGKPVFNQYPH